MKAGVVDEDDDDDDDAEDVDVEENVVTGGGRLCLCPPVVDVGMDDLSAPPLCDGEDESGVVDCLIKGVRFDGDTEGLREEEEEEKE